MNEQLIRQHQANARVMRATLSAYEAVQDGTDWSEIDTRKAAYVKSRNTFSAFAARPEVRAAIRASIKVQRSA